MKTYMIIKYIKIISDYQHNGLIQHDPGHGGLQADMQPCFEHLKEIVNLN